MTNVSLNQKKERLQLLKKQIESLQKVVAEKTALLDKNNKEYNTLAWDVLQLELKSTNNKLQYLFNKFYDNLYDFHIRDNILCGLTQLLQPYYLTVIHDLTPFPQLSVRFSFQIDDSKHNNKIKEGLKLVLPYVRPISKNDYEKLITNENKKFINKIKDAIVGMKIIEFVTFSYAKYKLGILKDGACVIFESMEFEDGFNTFNNLDDAFEYVYSVFFQLPSSQGF